MPVKIAVAGTIIVVMLLPAALNANHPGPPVPRPAPAWDVAEWINSEGMELADLKGRVVIVEIFQLWCPGCNRFSKLLIKKWEKDFARQIKKDQLTIVSVHTAFEGHSYQNPKRLRRYLKQNDIRHPVAVDRLLPAQHIPQTMRLFGTRGTPEMAIIDKRGVIRFQRFGGFQVRPAEQLIRDLLAE